MEPTESNPNRVKDVILVLAFVSVVAATWHVALSIQSVIASGIVLLAMTTLTLVIAAAVAHGPNRPK